MNKSKTELIYFGESRQLEKCITNTINNNGEDIQWSNVTIYLSWLSRLNTLASKNTLKLSVKWPILNLLKIEQLGNTNWRNCAKLPIPLVISHLDYGNAILAELPKDSLDKIQRVQNMEANIVLNKGNY